MQPCPHRALRSILLTNPTVMQGQYGHLANRLACLGSHLRKQAMYFDESGIDLLDSVNDTLEAGG